MLRSLAFAACDLHQRDDYSLMNNQIYMRHLKLAGAGVKTHTKRWPIRVNVCVCAVRKHNNDTANMMRSSAARG